MPHKSRTLACREDMRVGVLTFHSAHNYGAVLQAYALSAFLKKNGCDVEFVNYTPSYLKKRDAIFSAPENFGARAVLRCLANNFCRFLALRSLAARRRKFDDFAKENFALTPVVDKSSIEALQKDAIFFGSDQIWNPRLTDGGDDIYLGRFKSSARKVAYAVSAGAFADELFESKRNRQALENFDMLSARERHLADRVSRIAGRDCPVLLDPVFLLEASDFSRIESDIAFGDYLFVYELSECKDIMKMARKIAAEKGLKIVRLKATYKLELPFGKLIDVSPQQFLSLVKNAKCVLTTSFHGTALSVIFRRDFYFVSMGRKNEGRISQLLGGFNLSSRITSVGEFEKFAPVQWGEDVERAIAELSDKSRRFVIEALNSARA